MINVSMRDQKEIDMRRVVGFSVPVACFNIRTALMHPAVNGESRLIGFDNKTGAGDFSGRSEKFNFHGEILFVSSFEVKSVAGDLPGK